MIFEIETMCRRKPLQLALEHIAPFPFLLSLFSLILSPLFYLLYSFFLILFPNPEDQCINALL